MNKKISCESCENSNCYIKQFFSTDLLALIDRQKYQTCYKKGQVIFKEGSPVLGIYFIQNIAQMNLREK